MPQVMTVVLLIFLGVFVGVMLREPRSLWSGFSFFLLLLAFGAFLLTVAAVYASWLTAHRWLFLTLVLLAGAAALLALVFPLLLLGIFAVEGERLVRREALRPGNLLSLACAAWWFGFLFQWPAVGGWSKGSLGTALYIAVSCSAVYLLALMAMYVLSALLNLFHFRQSRKLDYIIVLGAGLNGDQVPPLLAGRIDRGLRLLARNPGARLVLSGGQGPGETLPEGRAMAAYAIARGADPARLLVEDRSANTEENLRFSRALMPEERPRIAVVTTAYHVFRALLIARRQGIRCVGYGAKTRWYFTLNAVLREFAGYLKLTKKRHLLVLGLWTGLILLLYVLSR